MWYLAMPITRLLAPPVLRCGRLTLRLLSLPPPSPPYQVEDGQEVEGYDEDEDGERNAYGQDHAQDQSRGWGLGK